MAKRIISRILVLLAAFSVTISHIIPHHHHHENESIVCFADDQPEETDCCDGEHHSPDGNCCGVKSNLITQFGDSRKEESHCDCHADHLFHGGHLYILLAALPDPWVRLDEPLAKTYDYPPYSNLYHSVLTEGHIGLRAPPVV